MFTLPYTLFKSSFHKAIAKHFKDNQLIDFIKIILKDFAHSKLENNLLLNFFDSINLTTGELKTTNRNGNRVTPSKNASYNGLEFKIYDTGTITVTGSLHKYWNSGAHNYNDFNIDAVMWVLGDLKTKFDIEPEQCILKCLEIGINIMPPIPTNVILDNCFLHKTKPFEWQKNSDEGKFKQVQHSQYIIKIYNKALHYLSKGFTIDTEIIRFEIKYLKMEKLNKIAIFSLNDLVNYGLHNFKKDLLNEWKNILYFDNTTRIDHLSTKTKNALLEYSNPNYWTGLLENNQTENFKYHKKQLKKITSENSNRVQDLTVEIINKKIDFLNPNATRIDPLTILSNRVVFNNSNDPICKITGLNISMQRDDSILLSHTGLKYYHRNNPVLFEQLKNKYLSSFWYDFKIETQIKELAHNIRNTKSNRKIKQNRIYPKHQYQLF